MKIRYTYTVVREETITEQDIKEYGKLLGDNNMTIDKYVEHMQCQQDDEGAEFLYGTGADEQLIVKVEVI